MCTLAENKSTIWGVHSLLGRKGLLDIVDGQKARANLRVVFEVRVKDNQAVLDILDKDIVTDIDKALELHKQIEQQKVDETPSIMKMPKAAAKGRAKASAKGRAKVSS